MAKAAPQGDIFITVTGDCDVIRPEHFKVMKNGVILANSGHFDIEIDVGGLRKMASRRRLMRPYFEEYTLMNRGKKKFIYLIGEGRLANLAAAEGHPSEVMSMSFCGQALAVEYLISNKGKLKAGLYDLPEALDIEIAKLQLESMGIYLDRLTARQKAYLSGWTEGT